jgi:hypothetical protein
MQYCVTIDWLCTAYSVKKYKEFTTDSLHIPHSHTNLWHVQTNHPPPQPRPGPSTYTAFNAHPMDIFSSVSHRSPDLVFDCLPFSLYLTQ